MELRHLKYFLAVAETQNIRLAAQRVHVTQPAISRKIKELEQELGVELFDRLPKGLRLNRAGKVYQKHLGAIFHQIDEANNKVRQLAQTQSGNLALGAPDFILWEGNVTQYLNRFRQANLQVGLEAFSDTPIVLLKRLELEQIDGAFIYCAPQLSCGYSIEPIAADRLLLAYPACWNETFDESLDVATLNQFPAVQLPRSADPYYSDWLNGQFRKMGWLPKSTQWAHSENTILGLVAAGNGVAIVNERHLTRPSSMIKYTPLDILPARVPLSFIYKNGSDNPALAAFLTFITEAESEVTL